MTVGPATYVSDATGQKLWSYLHVRYNRTSSVRCYRTRMQLRKFPPLNNKLLFETYTPGTCYSKNKLKRARSKRWIHSPNSTYYSSKSLTRCVHIQRKSKPTAYCANSLSSVHNLPAHLCTRRRLWDALNMMLPSIGILVNCHVSGTSRLPVLKDSPLLDP